MALMFANGSYNDVGFYENALAQCPDAYVVAVDGGLNFLGSINRRPDLIIGDLDSVNMEYVKRYGDVETLRFPPEKDDTDTELALKILIERGYRVIVMLGVIGSRIDHSLSNIFLLRGGLADRAELYIANEHNLLRSLKGPDCLRERLREGQTVSVLPLCDEVRGLTLEGFKYPLRDFDMDIDNPGRGLSNVVTEDRQSISLKSGTILIDFLTDPE